MNVNKRALALADELENEPDEVTNINAASTIRFLVSFNNQLMDQVARLTNLLPEHIEQPDPLPVKTYSGGKAWHVAPTQQEPVAEVKAKMTGGNVGIATVIHEIHSPLREPLQPGDKLYSAYRWIGWDVEQVWSERIFGIDMRFENVQDAIAFRKKLEEAAHGITKDQK